MSGNVEGFFCPTCGKDVPHDHTHIETPSRAWWCICEESILEALRRAHAGEDPDHIYAELYANSEHERYGK